jgi:hypothetical protein
MQQRPSLAPRALFCVCGSEMASGFRACWDATENPEKRVARPALPDTLGLLMPFPSWRPIHPSCQELWGACRMRGDLDCCARGRRRKCDQQTPAPLWCPHCAGHRIRLWDAESQPCTVAGIARRAMHLKDTCSLMLQGRPDRGCLDSSRGPRSGRTVGVQPNVASPPTPSRSP